VVFVLVYYWFPGTIRTTKVTCEKGKVASENQETRDNTRAPLYAQTTLRPSSVTQLCACATRPSPDAARLILLTLARPSAAAPRYAL
jgi:hypothetical protein